MTRAQEHEVQIEEGGRILRGLALPYGQTTYVLGPGRRGEKVAHGEVFDADSLVDVGAMYGRPLLLAHDESRPIGRILATRSTERGLEVEAELLGSDEELTSIRAKAQGGVLSSMSVGFRPNRKLDKWQPPDASGLPWVLRRGAEVREISVCLWPAYDSAKVLSILARTAAARARKEASDKEIEAAMAAVSEAKAFLKRRR